MSSWRAPAETSRSTGLRQLNGHDSGVGSGNLPVRERTGEGLARSRRLACGPLAGAVPGCLLAPGRRHGSWMILFQSRWQGHLVCFITRLQIYSIEMIEGRCHITPPQKTCGREVPWPNSHRRLQFSGNQNQAGLPGLLVAHLTKQMNRKTSHGDDGTYGPGSRNVSDRQFNLTIPRRVWTAGSIYPLDCWHGRC